MLVYPPEGERHTKSACLQPQIDFMAVFRKTDPISFEQFAAARASRYTLGGQQLIVSTEQSRSSPASSNHYFRGGSAPRARTAASERVASIRARCRTQLRRKRDQFGGHRFDHFCCNYFRRVGHLENFLITSTI
eukprot:Selendium_serpulae@DN2945_c0_g1_i2.p1